MDFWDVTSEDEESMTDVNLCDSQMTLLSETDLGYVIDFYRYTYGQNSNDDMVGDVEKEIIQCKYHTKCDNHSCVIAYSADNLVSKHSSCIIHLYIATSKQIIFGKIIKHSNTPSIIM